MLVNNPLVAVCLYGLICQLMPLSLAFAAGRWWSRNQIIIKPREVMESDGV